MPELAAAPSRRALLQAMAVVPVTPSFTTPDLETREPARLVDVLAVRALSRDNRSLSRFRYHNAESFFRSLEDGPAPNPQDMLYRTGIVAQLALSAHLLDIGLADDWCARNIGLNISTSLSYANATGLGHTCEEMARLADVLTPYWKWRQPVRASSMTHDDGGFTAPAVRPLLRSLLDRVRHVTGHPRPRGWRNCYPSSSGYSTS